MKALDHKCPACSAKLPFNPVTQKWDCEYCANSYTLEELKKYEKKNAKEKNIEADVYECPNCGAKVITDKNTTATFCVYCGSTSIMKDRLKDEFKPLHIIPFKTTKEEAIEKFKAFKKGKIFAPDDFNNEENIQKITGVYIPFWAYDCSAHGKINAHAENIKIWRSGNYRYTKTDRYSVSRVGNMEFHKVPVDGSTKFDNNTMNSIEPFDYDELKEFDMSYLSGFLSEKYDLSKEKAAETAYERIKESTLEQLRGTIRAYDTVKVLSADTEVNTNKAEYILLPVWMLNIKYKDQMHLFAMNGQTGKMVGDIPIDKDKRIITWIKSFIGITAVSSLLVFLIKLFA